MYETNPRINLQKMPLWNTSKRHLYIIRRFFNSQLSIINFLPTELYFLSYNQISPYYNFVEHIYLLWLTISIRYQKKGNCNSGCLSIKKREQALFEELQTLRA
jgi:hypothetical protein